MHEALTCTLSKAKTLDLGLLLFYTRFIYAYLSMGRPIGKRIIRRLAVIKSVYVVDFVSLMGCDEENPPA